MSRAKSSIPKSDSMPVTTINRVPRNLGLDLLRLFAILLVIGNHLRPPPSGKVGIVLACWMRGGWVGVDLFFVLSGYLVAGLLFKEYSRRGHISVMRFLVRRGLKIYPAFWALIAFSVMVFWAKGQSVPFRNIAGELCFGQNYFAHIWPHTWSLAIEEHFYLCLALAVSLLLRRRGLNPLSWFPVIFVVIATACLALRILNAIRHPEYNYSWDLFPTHLRIDSLFFGAYLAYLSHFQRFEERIAWLPTWSRLMIGFLLLMPAFLFARETHRWVTVIGFNLFYLGSGMLVLGIIKLQGTSFRFLRALGVLGASSYSIYLWHVPINAWYAAKMLDAHPNAPGIYWGYVAICVGGALLFGYGMAVAVEVPILKLRDHFYPSATRARAASPVDGTAPLRP